MPVLVALGAALAVLAAHHAVLGLGLLGWDTFPMILTARVHSIGDFVGTFTEELMDGRYTDGRFYRPVANLTFALDEALFGLSPAGYHATDLLILAFDGLLIGALALRLWGRHARWASVVAALAFVLHPVQLELLPVAPRRADLVALGFVVATLLARRATTAAVLGLCAMGAKETGILVLPLAAALGVVERPRGSAAGRAAIARAWPTAVAAALFLAARTAVLGGLGGHGESSLAHLAAAPELLLPYLARVLYPQPFVASTTLASAIVAGAALALVAAALLRVAQESDDERRRGRGALVFLGSWALLALALSCVSGRVHDWYALWLVAPYALALGWLLERGVRGLRRPEHRFVASVTLAVPVLLLSSHVRHSGIFGGYDDWRFADRLHADALARAGAAIDGARPGDVVVLERFVPVLPVRPDGSGVRSAALLSDYGLQAWTELTRPDRPVRVAYVGQAEPQAAPDEVLVLLEPSGPPAR